MVISFQSTPSWPATSVNQHPVSVACAIGPSVNSLLNELILNSKCELPEAQTNNLLLFPMLLLQGGNETLGIHVYGLLHLEKDSEKRRNRHGDEARVGDNSVRRKGVTAASCIEGRRGASLQPTNQPIGASPPLPSLFSRLPSWKF